jgi:hypothetical protein
MSSFARKFNGTHVLSAIVNATVTIIVCTLTAIGAFAIGHIAGWW